jgi:hypothetical protein
LRSFLSAEPAYEEARPAIGADAVGLTVADSVIELLAPTGDGAIATHLRRHGPGIRSAVRGHRVSAQAERYFAERGIAPVPGDRPGALAIPAEANLGIILEFAA